MADHQAAQVVHRQRMQTFARHGQPRLVVRTGFQVTAFQERRLVQRRRLSPHPFIGAAHGGNEARDIDADRRMAVELHPFGIDMQTTAQLATAQRAQLSLIHL